MMPSKTLTATPLFHSIFFNNYREMLNGSSYPQNSWHEIGEKSWTFILVPSERANDTDDAHDAQKQVKLIDIVGIIRNTQSADDLWRQLLDNSSTANEYNYREKITDEIDFPFAKPVSSYKVTARIGKISKGKHSITCEDDIEYDSDFPFAKPVGSYKVTARIGKISKGKHSITCEEDSLYANDYPVVKPISSSKVTARKNKALKDKTSILCDEQEL